MRWRLRIKKSSIMGFHLKIQFFEGFTKKTIYEGIGWNRGLEQFSDWCFWGRVDGPMYIMQKDSENWYNTHRSHWWRCVQFQWLLETSLLSYWKTPFIQSSQCVPLTYAFSEISLANLTTDLQHKIFYPPFTIHLLITHLNSHFMPIHEMKPREWRLSTPIY